MRASSLRLVTCVAALKILLAGRDAGAKEQFPHDIQRDLNLNYTPPCRLCHIQGTTGAGSISTPFAISMLAHGMTGTNSSLPPALDAMRTDKTDSDGDGTPDVDELVANTDPNTPLDASLLSSDPRYGCSAAGSSPAPRAFVALFGLLLVSGAALVGRRRPAIGPSRKLPDGD